MNYDIARRRMVETQLRARGIRDERVIAAMLQVPRHLFVEEALAAQAYSDSPLPIGERQTISQPYMVALMTELLQLSGYEKVLEIGTGSGYQAAILATIANRVCTIERHRPLALQARRVLDQLCLLNVNIRIGDGTMGWPEEAPFDAIVVTAGAPHLPPALVAQLKPGGRLVIPVGDLVNQSLEVCVRQADGSLQVSHSVPCRFVPLVGESGWQGE